MRPTHTRIAATFTLLGLAALGAGCGKPPDAPGGHGDQVAEGGLLYVAHCAKCHGPTGAGTEGSPAVVGKGALPLDPPPTAKTRKAQFRTGKDVLDFIRVSMPKDAPGSLSETQYADILAFDLKLNKVDLHGLRVNESNASTFILHP